MWGVVDMDVLFVSSKYHPYVGGVQTQMRIVAQALTCRHRVEVATLLPDHDSYLDGAIAVHSLKLSVTDTWRMRLLGLLPKRQRNVRCWLGYQLYRSIFLPKLRPLVRGKHVVHALKTEFLSRIAAEAARLEGVPFALTPYIHPSNDARTTIKQRAEAAFCNRADTVFALLETDREMLVDLGVERKRIRLAGVMPLLPPTSDPEGFRARHGLGQKPIVLFIGRMLETKGFKTLVDAASQVWREMPDVQFVFAGPADEAALRWFADRGDQRIRYLGLIDEEEKGDALAACDLFCMPSTAEILPAVYLEAWNYGKAVIGGSAHGLRELIEENGGGLTVRQHPELLASRLVELLRDEPRRLQMGERGRELVARRFSPTALVNAVENAYEALRAARANEASNTQKVEVGRNQPIHA